MHRTVLVSLACLALSVPLPGAAQATDDAEVLAPAVSRAPEAAALPVAQRVRTLIAEGRATADPRAMGRAEALLTPALAAAPGDADLLTLRATLRSWDHDFAGAMADYAAVLAARPQDPQARLGRAFAAATLGDYVTAEADCRALPRHAGALPRAACHARRLGLTGKAVEAVALLGAARQTNPGGAVTVQGWVAGILADLHARLGDFAAAEVEARAALAADPASEVARLRLAQVLVRAGRPAPAAAVLEGPLASDDALLLRIEAGRAAGQDRAADVALLGDRLAAARRDGVVRHLRVEAVWQAVLNADPDAGLAAAEANWAVQKEPDDLNTLLRLAALAGRPEAAAGALAFRAAHGLQDVETDRLATALHVGGTK